MANGIDYGLVRDLGGAKAQGQAQAINQMQALASLQDYMAKQQAKSAVAGGAGLPTYYEQELRKEAYNKDISSKMPFIQQMIQVGDRTGLEELNKGLITAHGTDLHNTELTNLVPGKYVEVQNITSGMDLASQFPELAEAGLDPAGNYTMRSRIGVDGAVEVTAIEPYIGKAKKMDTINLELGESGKVTPGVTHVWQYDPETGERGKYIGRAKTAGAGEGEAAKTADIKAGHKALLSRIVVGTEINPDDMLNPQTGEVVEAKVRKNIQDPKKLAMWDIQKKIMEKKLVTGRKDFDTAVQESINETANYKVGNDNKVYRPIGGGRWELVR